MRRIEGRRDPGGVAVELHSGYQAIGVGGDGGKTDVTRRADRAVVGRCQQAETGNWLTETVTLAAGEVLLRPWVL